MQYDRTKLTMDIISNRIPATPRSKYARYNTGASYSLDGGGANIDTSNFVKLKGQISQIIDGSVGATGDIVAYQTNPEAGDFKLPIASTDALGCVRIGENLTITEDGVVNANAGGGVSSWNDLTDKPSTYASTWGQITGKPTVFPTNWDLINNKPTTFIPSAHKHLKVDITDFAHTHKIQDISDFIGVTINTDQTITGQKTFTKTILGLADVVAYATGDYTESFPIASTNALGCVKIGNNLSIREDGTVDANAGGITEVDWSIIKNKPSFAMVATSGSYNDLSNKPTIPTSLKSPYSLTISLNGTSQGAYDGSVAKSININYTNVGAAAASHSHSNYSVTGHTYDDRYYTESEINTKLASKSDTSHTHSQYLTGVSLANWNAGATASGTKTIGNAGNSAYVDIQEDLRVKKACTFSSTPTVNGTSVSLNGHTHSQYSLTSHTHSYLPLGGGTLTGALTINSNDYSNVKVLNTKSDWGQFGTTNTTDVSCTIQANKKVLIMARNQYGQHVEFDKGNILAYGNVTAYVSSDKRLKKDIKPLTNSLNLINQLEPVQYRWNNKAIELDSFKDTENRQYGLIAQDVEKLIPDIVHDQYKDGGTTYKSIDYVKIIPLLIDCIQDLSKQITELKTKTI